MFQRYGRVDSISIAREVLGLSTLSPGTPLDRELGRSGHMTVKPNSMGLWAARSQVGQVAHELSLPAEDAADLLLAVGEALSNAYLHGSPNHATNLILVGWRFAGEVLTVTVKDEGGGFRPREAASLVGAAGLRGRGLRLMRQSVDEVHFEFDGGTRVVLRKRVAR
jgi:anti-sigma regulatory factor (Ser/Thr protein kinase)